MSHLELILYSCILIFLILLSGFFSTAETGLMAVNRYRLRHKARLGKHSAILILRLLKRPDRLLGMILIGNILANIVASALATFITMHYWGEKGVVLSTIVLTFFILIFAEVAPKTVAALHPDKVSKIVAWPVHIMLIIFFPLVWLVNTITNGLLHLLRINVGYRPFEPLSREELRSVVYDTAGKMSRQYQSMLLGILDLNKASVDDVMIPRHQMIGVDIDKPWISIQEQLSKSPHDWLPVYRNTVNEMLGVLHLRDVMRKLILGKAIDKDMLLKLIKEPYYIPEGTPLNIQLLNFQQLRKRTALVVDEYGEIVGLVTLEDILEEIVGEFTTNVVSTHRAEKQADGSYIADGSITLRELNRITQWQLPTDGPRTLNGLIIEHLEALPTAGISMLIGGHPIELKEVKENRVVTAHVFPLRAIDIDPSKIL